MRALSAVPPLQLAVFRILLAALVAGQILAWWPWADALFGVDGLPALHGEGLAGVLPSPLSAAGGPMAPRPFLALLLVLAAALGLGVARPLVAVALWYGWTCLGHASPDVQTVASAYVGWLLLALALVPPGEPLRPVGARRPGGGRVPVALFAGAWIVLAAGYGLAGIDKLSSPGWRSGDALRVAVDLPYAREAVGATFLALPRGLQRVATWTGLGIELLFPLLALGRSTRPLAWAAGAMLQLALLVLFAFPGLTVGMLLMHAFTFDARWLDAAGKARARLGRTRPRETGAIGPAGGGGHACVRDRRTGDGRMGRCAMPVPTAGAARI